MRTLPVLLACSLLAVLALSAPAARGQRSCDGDVCVVASRRGEGVVFHVTNGRAEPVEATLYFPVFENATADADVPRRVVVAPGARREALALTAREPSRPWRYTYRFDWQLDPAACARPVCVRTERDLGGLALVADNRTGAPVSLTLRLNPAARVEDDPAPPETTLVAPGPGAVLRRWPADAPRPRYRFGWRLGAPGLLADSLYAYALPYPAGQAYVLTQGPDSAAGPQNRYAFGWEMPAGTPVRAAREGVAYNVVDSVVVVPMGRPVLGSERRAEPGGRPVPAGRSVRAQALNYVFVAHADGTVGRYLGLGQGSARVAVGDRVARGAVLGTAAGPTVSFSVVRFEGGTQQTLPIRFGVGGRAVVPREGDSFVAE